MTTNLFKSAVTSILVIGSFALTLGGCASIQSDAVRSLIDKEAEKVNQAAAKSKDFAAQTADRRKAYEKALRALDDEFKIVHTNEALYALIFSSHQNVESKAGIDALAVAYLAGVLYLNDQAGLDKAVKEQFDTDFAALADLSKKIPSSWSSIAALQAKVQKYSKQSAIASIDPEFVEALLKQAKVDTSDIDRVVKKSKELNDVLQNIGKVKALQGKALERGQQSVNDLIDLLNQVKK